MHNLDKPERDMNNTVMSKFSFILTFFESLWSISYTNTWPEWQDPFGCQGDLRRQLCDLCEISWRLEVSSTVAQGLACGDIKIIQIWWDEMRRSPLRSQHDLGSSARKQRNILTSIGLLQRSLHRCCLGQLLYLLAEQSWYSSGSVGLLGILGWSSLRQVWSLCTYRYRPAGRNIE